jgi:transcriptional regulator with XRE-family HTH domain
MARSTILSERYATKRRPAEAEDVHVHLGNRLRLARSQAKLSQSALARATALPVATLARYEAGVDQMSVDHLMALAATLKLNPIFFFDDPGDKAPSGFAALERPKASPRNVGETRTLVEAYQDIARKSTKNKVLGLLGRINARQVN